MAARYFSVRIRGVGKVCVTGFTDDCSRYRVKSKVYLCKDAASVVNALRWAPRAGRVPREIYPDNGKQFVSKIFKAEALKHGIKLIFGMLYNPRCRGRIERYHKTLYQELIALKEFRSLKPFQMRTLEFPPSVQQLAQAGDPGLVDSRRNLPQQNQFQQTP